ncbi:hypothetical protein PF005_g4791 [Phytophthora fragariae]|uniref:Uncharacterized protein n=1 Tax=Phytophthora fragariae TaxID=53985 RepID=A0A6A3YZL2_9STRA|nr:hypothetical protein PF005_g4791 [Phytophthora fragariae]
MEARAKLALLLGYSLTIPGCKLLDLKTAQVITVQGGNVRFHEEFTAGGTYVRNLPENAYSYDHQLPDTVHVARAKTGMDSYLPMQNDVSAVNLEQLIEEVPIAGASTTIAPSSSGSPAESSSPPLSGSPVGADATDHLSGQLGSSCALYTGEPHKADMAVALHCLTYVRGPVRLYWRGRRMEVATPPLRGAVSERYWAVEAGLYGVFCAEWIPPMVLSAMRLYSETGAVVNPNTRFRKLSGSGVRLKDVVHWQWAVNGNIVDTVLLQRVTTAVQGQTTTVDHHHLHRHLTLVAKDAGLKMAGSTQPVAPIIQTHKGLEMAMQTEVGDGVLMSSVHPHPPLARMVCLWAGHRWWKQTRKQYKAVLLKDKMVKGLKMT